MAQEDAVTSKGQHTLMLQSGYCIADSTFLSADEIRKQDETGKKRKMEAPLDESITRAVCLFSHCRTLVQYSCGTMHPMPDDELCLGDSSMPLQVLEPLQMACVMDVPRIAEPALGCLHKLVSRPAQPKRVSLCMLMACCHI